MIRETELISLKDGKTKNLTEFVKDLAPTPEPMDLTPTTPVDTGGADPVALSSYIDGIADTSASDAINAGLDSGGSIANAISSGASAAASAAITAELGTGGDIKAAIDTAVSNAPVKSYTDLNWTVENYFYDNPGHTNVTINIPKTKNVLIAMASNWIGSDGNITAVDLYTYPDWTFFIPKNFKSGIINWKAITELTGWSNNNSTLIVDSTGANFSIGVAPDFGFKDAIFVFSAE